MPSLTRPTEYDGFAPVLLANLVPLVGVVAVGWDAATLSVIYAAEVVLSLPLAAVETLFAQRHPPDERNGFVSVGESDLIEKRGGVEVAAWLPPVYPRNVPFAIGVVMAVFFLPAFLVVALSKVLPLTATLARPEVLASAAGLVLAGVAETARDFFGRREYEDVSPYGVIETPVRRGFFLVFLLFVAPGLEAAFGGVGVLGLLVVGKLYVEHSAYRAAHGEGGRFSAWLAGPDEAVEPEPVTVPEGDPTAVFPTDRRTVLLAGTFETLVQLGPFCVSFGTLSWLTLSAMLPSSVPTFLASALIVLALCLAAIAVRIGAHYLVYAPLEYRRYDDRVLAYDAWLDEPQWSAPLAELRDVSVVDVRLADRLRDTRTFEVTTGWGDDEHERQIGPLVETDAVVESLDLPVRTELEPFDRRYAVAAVATAAVVAAGYAAVALASRASLEPVVLAAFLFPFPALIVVGIWRQGYPDDGEGWPTPEYAVK